MVKILTPWGGWLDTTLTADQLRDRGFAVIEPAPIRDRIPIIVSPVLFKLIGEQMPDELHRFKANELLPP